MCTIAGNNLFGQWKTNNCIVPEFLEVPLCKHTDPGTENMFKIVEINWSYNIYKTEDSYYVSGRWANIEKQFAKVNLPENLKGREACNLLVTGNEYKLFFVEKDIAKLYIANLHDFDVKEVGFNEAPVVCSPKKKKEVCKMRKAKATNDSLVCLTDTGVVYNGILPSLINTEHCLGSVIDVVCGFEHFVLLTEAGGVYTWGNGRRLQLGHGDLSNLDTPTEVEALAGVKVIKISAGGWHSAALSEFGDLCVLAGMIQDNWASRAKKTNRKQIPIH